MSRNHNIINTNQYFYIKKKSLLQIFQSMEILLLKEKNCAELLELCESSLKGQHAQKERKRNKTVFYDFVKFRWNGKKKIEIKFPIFVSKVKKMPSHCIFSTDKRKARIILEHFVSERSFNVFRLIENRKIYNFYKIKKMSQFFVNKGSQKGIIIIGK